MFSLEGSGFIISIGLTFLLSGIIMYYCNSEVARLNLEISKQNNVIVDLLERFKSSVSVNNMNHVANPVAIQSAHTQHLHESQQNGELIPVSDCGSSSEEESDEESDDDSDDESGEMLAQDVTTNADISVSEETVKVIDLETNTNSPEQLVIEEIPDDENNKTVQLAESSSNESESDDSESSEKSEPLSTDYKQLKVNELKEILINDKNIEPKTLKNLKKEELIQLLQKK